MKKARIITKDYDLSLARQLAETMNLSLPIAKLLLTRNIRQESQARFFLNPNRSSLHNPFLLTDMDKAVDLIGQVIKKQGQICIYGDYDVDGITSTSLLYLFFQEIGARVTYYLPDRMKEGYGLNEKAIRQIADRGIDLVITVDTGISAVKEVALAKQLGLKVVVTDHHECQAILPPADAVVDPKRPDDPYPFKQIAGVGVAFKLITALSQFMKKNIDPFKYLDLVAIGTVSDLMPLMDENRVFVKEALAKMKETQNQGLKALLQVAEVDQVTSGAIGFRLGPRLNAAGRMGDAQRGVELFTTRDAQRAMELALELNEENKNRQDIESKIVEEALAQIEASKDTSKVLVVAGQGWHHGVIGIVASRILDRFYRPVIVLAVEGDQAVGSARSVEGFNLFEALVACQDLFIKFGGHEMAAGMTLARDKIDQLRQRINAYAEEVLTAEILTPREKIDFKVDLSEISIPMIEELHQLAPYGIGNPEPKFLLEGHLAEIRQMGKENQHLRLALTEDQGKIDGVAFFEGQEADRLYPDFPVQVTGHLQINEWNGIRKPQLMISYFSQENDIYEFAVNLYHQLKALDRHPNLRGKRLDRKGYKQIYVRLRSLVKEGSSQLSWQDLPRVFECKTKEELGVLIVALAIFEELDLCPQVWTRQGINLALTKGLKVDLEQSKIYQSLL